MTQFSRDNIVLFFCNVFFVNKNLDSWKRKATDDQKGYILTFDAEEGCIDTNKQVEQYTRQKRGERERERERPEGKKGWCGDS